MSRIPAFASIFALAMTATPGLFATGAMAAGGPYDDFSDPKSGFEVKVPATFVQTPAQPDDGRRVLLKRVGGEGVFCAATFAQEAAPGADEGASVRDVARRWRASAAAKGRTFVSASAFGRDRRAPPAAVAIVSDRRGDLVGFPRQRRRSLTILWETPKGLTSLACESPKVRFGILRREFETLAGGVTPPR